MERVIRYQAAVVREAHVLLLQVADRLSGRTFWLFPGGGLEAGETEEACVRREVFEETYLRVAVERWLFECPDLPGGMYQQVRTYLCRVIEGEPRPGREPEIDTEEHAAIRATGWFDLRHPEGWGAAVRNDPFTQSLMERLQVELGYLSPGGELETG